MNNFKNGRYPLNLFQLVAKGTDGDGYWEHRLTAGTYAKWLRLRDIAYGRHKKWLQLSSGWSGYRPFEAQEHYQRVYGKGAATPGASSHGLFWEGRTCLAIDVGNWGDVYGGNRAQWFADARQAGFAPDLISPHRGYPDEPWHIIDFDPWATPAAETLEDDEMIVFIGGRSGVRNAGVWLLKGGKATLLMVASRYEASHNLPLIPSESAVKALAKQYTGIPV